MTAQQLADRCAELGVPLGHVSIAKLETGRRKAVTPFEVIALAVALGVPPIDLIWPVGYTATVEVLPGAHLPPLDAVKWFWGGTDLEVAPDGTRTRPPRVNEMSNVSLLRMHDTLTMRIGRKRDELIQAREFARDHPGNEQAQWVLGQMEKSYAEWAEVIAEQLPLYRAQMEDRGMVLPAAPQELTTCDGSGGGE